MEMFLLKKQLPRWYVEECVADREFLSFHPQLATLDVNDLYFGNSLYYSLFVLSFLTIFMQST